MPKSSKKRKEKAADFSKAKLKLGKGKQTPTNAVDTSFKARSIALPTQTIAHDADRGVPTTRRKLTLDDLISHLKHYSAGVRKDAILGLRELFEDHPGVVVSSLSITLSNCARIIGDEDASVRKALLAFLGWLLPRVPHDTLVPHTQILLLFTTSAQTHIFPEIRVDAIRFLDLYLELFPDVVVEGWIDGHAGHGRRVLEGYLGILNAGTAYGEGGDTSAPKATSTASVILSPASKLVVLKSLGTFLSRAMSTQDPGRYQPNAEDISAQMRQTPTWFMAAAFSSPSAFAAFDGSIKPNLPSSNSSAVRRWREENDPDGDEEFVGSFPLVCGDPDESWSFESLSHLEFGSLAEDVGSSSGIKPESAYISHLARTLHPTLVSTFLDCAPAVFSPGSSPSETELEMVLAVTRLAHCLYAVVSLESADKSRSPYDDLSSLLGHMSPYFPFMVHVSPLARRDQKTEQTLQDLNLTFCELTSTLMLKAGDAPNHSAPGSRRGVRDVGNPKQTSRLLETLVQRVSEYTVRLLRGEAPDRPDAQSLGPKAITPATYMSLLPTIWALLNAVEAEFADNVLQACVEHGTRASSTSAVKRHTVDLIGRLLLLDTAPEYRGHFLVTRYPAACQKLTEWLLHLPKTLWELGASNLPATETILKLLLRLLQRRSRFASAETVSQIRARMVPFFRINHPSRGALAGPFAKLPPSPVRTLVLDMVATLGPESSLDSAVQGAVQDQERDYWVSVSVVRST